jgi:hypothetical protein
MKNDDAMSSKTGSSNRARVYVMQAQMMLVMNLQLDEEFRKRIFRLDQLEDTSVGSIYIIDDVLHYHPDYVLEQVPPIVEDVTGLAQLISEALEQSN